MSRHIQLLLLTLTGAGAVYASSAVGPLQETMRIALSFSDNQMALLQGPALALPTAFLVIPLGLVIDRSSRVRLLLICAASAIAGSILTALASNFALLFMARCLVGLSITTMQISTYSLLADHYPPVQRGRAKAVLVMGQYGGKSAAFALGGAMLALVGLGPDGWRWAMLWLTVPLVAIALSMLVLREPPRTGRVAELLSTRKSLIEIWRYRAVLAPLLIGTVLVDFPIRAALVWAAPLFARNFALPPERVGAIMAIVLLVSGILGPISGGIVADLCERAGNPSRRMFVLSGLALLILPGCLYAVAPGVASMAVLLVLFVTAIGAVSAMAMTLFTIVIPNELRGLSLSLMVMANAIFAGALAPVLVSVLSGSMGGPAMIGKALTLICLVTTVLGASVFAMGSLHFRRAGVRQN